MKVKNTLWISLEWKPAPDGKGIVVKLDQNIYGLSTLSIVPIDEAEQRIIDRYDARRYQTEDDILVFYAGWSDGEWQPRDTYPDYDTAKDDVDKWWYDYTNELCEHQPPQ